MSEATQSRNGFRACPYCGHEQYVERSDEDAKDHVEECEECEKKYYARDELSWVYHARPDCELNGEQHEFPESDWDPPICAKCRSWRKGWEDDKELARVCYDKYTTGEKQ